MNKKPTTEILLRATDDAQSELPLVVEGVQRYVWEGKFGSMLIEIEDDRVFVNGQQVELMPPSASD